MPITKSVKKALRQSEKKNKKNNAFKTKLRGIVKAFLLKPSQEGLKETYSILDKAEKKNIYHKNKVNRLKSNFSKKVAKGTVKKTAKKVVKKTVKKPVEKKSGKKMSATK